VIEEASRALTMAQDPSFTVEHVRESIDGIKKQLDDFGEKLIRKKLGRAA
jgi:hypothetical protein